ncbi:MAG TPA: serine acetyltransferase [Polyangiales bacterium]|nr:serine acetyltransferase [Polyangiales bacterium]
MELPDPTIPRAESCPLLWTIRAYQAARNRVTRKALAALYKLQQCSSSCDIPLNCQLGLGLLLPHPIGIVIHPEARIGINCCIFQHVTIGTRVDGAVPRIGNCVEIGVGAMILGDVSVGDGAVIGAGAIVIRDVPAHHVAVGSPAHSRYYYKRYGQLHQEPAAARPAPDRRRFTGLPGAVR